MADDIYSKVTVNKVSNPYITTSILNSSEANMRQELIDTLEGGTIEIAKGYPALLRKFRLDSHGNKIKCSCVDVTTGEPDKDIYCPISMGEKYLWDEKYIKVYKVEIQPDKTLAEGRQIKTEAGLLNVPTVVFYLRYDIGIAGGDKIVEISLDLEGIPTTPVQRTVVYRIITLVIYRSDRGRVEYFKAVCTKDNVKFLNAPDIG